MSRIADILKGHTRELFDINPELAEKRMKICFSCPLYLPDLGGICNPKLWINPETDQVSDKPMFGWIKGCSCRLNAKTRNPNNHCGAGKW